MIQSKLRWCIKWGWCISLMLVIILASVSLVYADDSLPSDETTPADTTTDAAVVEAPAEESADEEPAAETPLETVESGETTEAEELAETPPEETPLPGEEELQPPEIVGETVNESSEAVDEEPAPEEALATDSGEAVTEEETPADDLPEEAAVGDVQLVNAEGETLDMASQESADVIAAADPYFKVGTTTYRFLAGVGACAAYPGDICQDNLAQPISAALAFMDANTILPTDRKLYVETGTYTENVTIDGLGSPDILAKLNGLIGVDHSWNITLNGDINILNNTGGFTLDGFTINGQVYADNNSGTLKLIDLNVTNGGGTGIIVNDHAGAVQVEDVESSGNANGGARIDNSIGNYPVKVTNAAFNSNGAGAGAVTGLHITSNRAVTINGISACGNEGDGLGVYDFSSLTITNTNLHANHDGNGWDNWGYGLYAVSLQSAPVKLEHVYASYNDGGFSIETNGNLTAKYIEANHNDDGVPGDENDHGLYFDSVVGSSKIEFSQFSYNAEDGLHISNKGNIYLNSIRAEWNGASGADLDNAYDDGITGYIGTGSITITSPKSGMWLQGNFFSNNGFRGLNIISRRSVSIYNADMADNGDNGIRVDNRYGSGNVTIGVKMDSWQNWIGSNGSTGVHIWSNGNVSINKTDAGWNAVDGFYMNVLGSITIKDSSANDNGSSGALLDNKDAARAKSVTITNCEFSRNQGAPWDGLEVSSKGNVILKGVKADDNAGGGLWIDATYGTGKVTISPFKSMFDSTMNGNGANGLAIFSFGSISIDGISAEGNGENGIWLYNPNSKGAVTIKNSRKDGFEGLFNDNGEDGIYVRTLGNISLMNVSASRNGFNGANLDNCLEIGATNVCEGFGSIKVSAYKDWMNTYNQNQGFGFLARTHGAITITNIEANQNGLDGAYLLNDFDGAYGSVKMNRSSSYLYNVFTENGLNVFYGGREAGQQEMNGLTVRSNGTITVQYAAAEGNNLNCGILLSNSGSPFVRAVTIQHVYAGGNGMDGISVDALGTISARDISGGQNGWAGAYLNNDYPAATGNIVLSAGGKEWNSFWGNNQAANNPAAGLMAFSRGTISISRVSSYENINGASGATLDNQNAPTAKYVSIADVYMNDNAYDGMSIQSNGAVTVKGADCYNNGGDGLWIISDGFGAKVTIGTISNHKANDFGSNAGNGLFIDTDGPISMQNIGASGNNIDGIWADNLDGDGNVAYSATNKSYFLINNGWSGMTIKTNGTIQITSSRYRIAANNNGTLGFDLANNTAVSPKNITLKNLVADNNGERGGKIHSVGSVTITSFAASNNTEHGLYIQNNFGTGYVTFKGSNIFKDNQQWGVVIYSKGYINLNNFEAVNNQQGGIFAETVTNSIKLTNATVRGNQQNGIWFVATYHVTLDKVRSFSNGFSGIGSGVFIETEDATSIVTLKNSAFQNNWDHGVLIDHWYANYWPTLYNTTFFGNDVGGDGDGNISVY